MLSGIELPLEVAALLCAGCMLVTAWASHRRTVERLDPRRTLRQDPLRDLLKPDNLGPAIDLAVHRDAQRRAANAMLHGQIDQLALHEGTWTRESAEAVRAHVAAVIRIGLRRQDRIQLDQGALFSILIPGADERAAVRIAERIRCTLAPLPLPGGDPEARLTVSFGVAAERVGEGRDGVEHRARRALEAAVMQGCDRVVPASDVDEIALLPPPAPVVSAA